jgi:hypothetical protein
MYIGGTPYTSNTVTWAGTNGKTKVTTNKGYDVEYTISPKRKEAAKKHTNGQLHDGTYFVNFFVTDVEEDIALAGTTAQSQYKMDFYAKNFVQPSFVITGVCLDQEDYGVLAEFIHQAQHKSLFDQSYASESYLTQLLVKGDVWPTGKSNPNDHNKRWQPIHVNKNGQQTTKGPHMPTIAKGHIASIPRIHEKFVYAPTFSFSFVVDQMIAGIYTEDVSIPWSQQSWSQIMGSQLGADKSPTDTSQAVQGSSLNLQPGDTVPGLGGRRII